MSSFNNDYPIEPAVLGGGDVERVKKALHYRGKVVRQADQIIQELQKS